MNSLCTHLDYQRPPSTAYRMLILGSLLLVLLSSAACTGQDSVKAGAASDSTSPQSDAFVNTDGADSDVSGGGEQDVGTADVGSDVEAPSGDTNQVLDGDSGGDSLGPQNDATPFVDVLDVQPSDAASFADVLSGDVPSGDVPSGDVPSGDVDDGGSSDGGDGVSDGFNGDAALTDGGSGSVDISLGVDADGSIGDGLAGDTAADVASATDATTDTTIDTSQEPWPADAWTGPLKPVTQNLLPSASFTDVSAAFGLNPTSSWAYCAVSGFVNDDDSPDAVLIEMKKMPNAADKVLIQTLLGGKVTKVVSSPFDTSLLYPDGGCALADLDGDGDGDLLVGGSSGLAYYAGNGKGGFVDVSAALLPTVLKAKVWSIAVDDFDGDGRLDILLGAGKQPESCAGVTCGHTKSDFICSFDKKPAADPFDDDRILIQQVSGAFVDATKTWKPVSGGIATSVASFDLNGDGRPDALIGDDFGGHYVQKNEGGKQFGKPISAGFKSYAHAMGWGIGDLNGDGAIDLVVADVGPLLVYAGKPGQPFGPWTSLPIGHPILAATWYTSSWVPQVVDLDHDGDLDIYLGVTLSHSSNLAGALTNCSSPTGGSGGQDLVMLNDGDFNFTIQTTPIGTCGRVAALAQSLFDIDQDGDLDVIQVRAGCKGGAGQLRILRNDLKKTGGSVHVRLIGPKGNRDAIGALLSTTVGATSVTRRIVGSVGMGSSGARRIHLGLGKATATGPITVTWPTGKKTQHGPLKAGAVVTWKLP